MGLKASAPAIAVVFGAIAFARSRSTSGSPGIVTFPGLLARGGDARGTAGGDFTADTLGLGYFGSIWLFAAIIAIPAIG